MHLTRFFLLSIFIYILVCIYCLLTFVDSIRASLVSLIHSSGSRTWKYENGIFVTTTRPVLCFFFFRSCGCGKFINAREKSCNALACVRGFATNFLPVPPLARGDHWPRTSSRGALRAQGRASHCVRNLIPSVIGIQFAVDVVTASSCFFFFFFFMELPCIDVQLHFYLINDPLEILNY